METSIIIGLLQNTAILLCFSMLYEHLWMKKEATRKLSKKILTGLIIGAIGIVIMFTPWKLVPGIVFDTRSVMLAISGLFFGAIPTAVAMLITGLLRIYQGGGGMYMGLAVILASGAIGVLWRYLRPEWRQKNYKIELLTLGFIVHFTMALCTLLLPPDKAWPTFTTISLPLLLIYTPATMLLGMLLVKQSDNWKNRLAKEKLRESERRLNQILESGNILTVILDLKGKIIFCNNYLLEISKYAHHEIIGKNWFELFLPENIRDRHQRIFQNLILKKNNTNSFESELLSKDGDVLYISWNSVALRSENSEHRGVASIGVNVTEHRHFESRLKEKNDKIEAQNQELIQKNQELLMAKQKAEESDQLKTSFLQNMSHEIRTPMNAIIGFSGLLNQSGLPDEKRQTYVSIITNSTKQLLGIVDDILTISAIDAKQEKLNLTEISLNSLLDDLITIFKPQLSGKNAELKLVKGLSDDESIIMADKTKTTQILTNLLSNALKFTKEGLVEFGYGIVQNNQENQEPGNCIEFFVKDTGIGITQDVQEKIFERFRQADLSISQKYGGNGLGLAISKAFAELMGGRIWVESIVDKGSTFYFTIPYQPVKQATKQNYPRLSPNKKATVLVTEDEEYSFLLIEEILAEMKFKVMRASDGQEAIDLCRTYPYIDVILMDIQMPTVDGYEAAKQIKAFKPGQIIIAQTAYALESDLMMLKNSNFDDYILKPINENELKQKVLKFIQHANS